MTSKNFVFGFIASVMCLSLASAHTYFSSLVINGQALGEGDCIRPHGNNFNFPISTVSSAEMTCGLPTSGSANRKCPVAAGSDVGIQWQYERVGDNYIIDPSHRGPCMVYMAKAETNGAGPVWFKIFEEGYNTQTNQFCVDRLLASPQKGLLNFKIPANLTPGNYLLRGEIIALHGAYAVGGAQPYVHCAEITVSGSGKAFPSSDSLVPIPGAYSNSDPGLLISIYQTIRTYVVPGPKVWDGASSSASTSSSSGTTPAAVTTGRAAAVTTGKAAPATTGKKTNTGTNTKATTGARPVTTGYYYSEPTPTPVPVPVPVPTGSCVSGNMKCLLSNTYSTCANGAWGVSQSCGTGLVCEPSGVYIYCVRPAVSVSPVTTPEIEYLPPVETEPVPSFKPAFECTQSLFGYQVCSSDGTYQTCVAGEDGPTWSIDLSCQEGLSCHASETANNIYCY